MSGTDNDKQEAHDQGQADGSEAGIAQEIAWVFNPFTSEEYDKGFENGLANKGS